MSKQSKLPLWQGNSLCGYREAVDVMYLGFRKAFDMILDGTLLSKLGVDKKYLVQKNCTTALKV